MACAIADSCPVDVPQPREYAVHAKRHGRISDQCMQSLIGSERDRAAAVPQDCATSGISGVLCQINHYQVHTSVKPYFLEHCSTDCGITFLSL